MRAPRRERQYDRGSDCGMPSDAWTPEQSNQRRALTTSREFLWRDDHGQCERRPPRNKNLPRQFPPPECATRAALLSPIPSAGHRAASRGVAATHAAEQASLFARRLSGKQALRSGERSLAGWWHARRHVQRPSPPLEMSLGTHGYDREVNRAQHLFCHRAEEQLAYLAPAPCTEQHAIHLNWRAAAICCAGYPSRTNASQAISCPRAFILQGSSVLIAKSMAPAG